MYSKKDSEILKQFLDLYLEGKICTYVNSQYTSSLQEQLKALMVNDQFSRMQLTFALFKNSPRVSERSTIKSFGGERNRRARFALLPFPSPPRPMH